MNFDAVVLLETVSFAAEKHRNQRRKDPEETPYINHPIGRLHFIYIFVLPSSVARISSRQEFVQNRKNLAQLKPAVPKWKYRFSSHYRM